MTGGVRALGRADAVVIVSDGRATCSVRRNDANTREVPCRDVSSYLRANFKLHPGATGSITAVGKVSRDTVAAVSADLSAHGFRVAGVVGVGFISESRGAR